MESAQPKQEEGHKQVQMGEKMDLNGSEIATNDHSQSAVKELVSAQEEEEAQQQQNIQEQSQEEEPKGEEEKGDKQVQMKNLDGAEIATHDHSQSEVNELVSAQDQEEEQQQQRNINEQSQEEEPKEEEEEGDVGIQREKKTLEGRTYSRDVQTQQYLDRLIRDNDDNLERGLMKAVGDFFDEFERFPDDDFPTLRTFVTSWLGLVDVPAGDLTNLMVLIGRMKPIIQAANRKKLYNKRYMGSSSNEIIKIMEAEENDDDNDDEDDDDDNEEEEGDYDDDDEEQ